MARDYSQRNAHCVCQPAVPSLPSLIAGFWSYKLFTQQPVSSRGSRQRWAKEPGFCPSGTINMLMRWSLLVRFGAGNLLRVFLTGNKTKSHGLIRVKHTPFYIRQNIKYQDICLLLTCLPGLCVWAGESLNQRECLRPPMWEEDLEESGCVYTYKGNTLLESRNDATSYVNSVVSKALPKGKSKKESVRFEAGMN